MGEKSYVTMSVCPICRKSSGSILMDRRLRPSFERETIVPTDVCSKCKKKYLSKGTMLINPQTARLVVIKDEVFKKMFNKPLPSKKIAFTDDELLDRLQKVV